MLNKLFVRDYYRNYLIHEIILMYQGYSVQPNVLIYPMSPVNLNNTFQLV